MNRIFEAELMALVFDRTNLSDGSFGWCDLPRVKTIFRRCILWALCSITVSYLPGQERETKASQPSGAVKSSAPRKKKVVTDGEDAVRETKPAKPAKQPDESNESQSTPDKVTHAPAASIEVSALAEFGAQPARVQQLIAAALDLTKLNLTYTYGSSEPSAGGMDCSGTIYYLLRSQGLKDVPRDSSGQYVWSRKQGQFFAVVSTLADSFEFKDLQPGDLLFWSGTYQTGRDMPISHVMLYLGHEKKGGKSVMFGSSDGRSYNGVQRWGVSVFDFKMPKADPANPEKHVDFVGYAHIPGLRDTPAVAILPTIQPVLTPRVAPPPELPPTDELREPERGSPERKAIMNALRTEKFPGQEDKVIFVVKRLKIHNGWAWSEVTPQDTKGKSVGEGITALLHYEGGKWKSVDLGKLSDQQGETKGVDASFAKALLARYPGVPKDILPVRRE